ncbi:hypothetical protein cypCar_00047404 [Cyprinus carpio]|nr:hypothetical protein cypCar_00047404 [Cyprinus carpio]
MEVVCCKSVGTDLSMLDIEDFITEICQLKKEVASLETNLDEDECVVSPTACGDHAQCENTEGSYNCICNEGFKKSSVQTCEDVDECVSSVCGVHSSCFNTPGSFRCICSPGFQRHENSTSGPCEDINECSDPDVCGTNANCSNHPGGYSCKCHEGYSNYGNNQSKCIKMNCDQFEPESDGDHTPKKLKHLMSLLKNSCESLNDPGGEHFTGEKLLQNLCSSSDELLSEGNMADGKMLNQFLDAVENSMRLIGPQLKEPVTRMETHNTCEK